MHLFVTFDFVFKSIHIKNKQRKLKLMFNNLVFNKIKDENKYNSYLITTIIYISASIM